MKTLDDTVQVASDGAAAFKTDLGKVIAHAAMQYDITMLDIAGVLQYHATRAFFFISPEYSRLSRHVDEDGTGAEGCEA